MVDELTEGIVEGRYIRLEQGWAVQSRWSGPLAVFRTSNDRFGVLVRSKGNVWRCYLGVLEGEGMHGVRWWEEYIETVVEGFKEGVGKIESYLDEIVA